jgi:hypothetical protein
MGVTANGRSKSRFSFELEVALLLSMCSYCTTPPKGGLVLNLAGLIVTEFLQ